MVNKIMQVLPKSKTINEKIKNYTSQALGSDGEYAYGTSSFLVVVHR